MIKLDEKDGLSWELVALLEVAAEEAGYDSLEKFIVCAASKKASAVLKSKPNVEISSELQLDLFGGSDGS